MPSHFQPLMSPSPASGSGSAAAFQKLPSAPLSITPTVGAPASSSHLARLTNQTGPIPAESPLISLDREGDRITRIHIRCTCGQVIDLDCDY
jgi:hypothetical protein